MHRLILLGLSLFLMVPSSAILAQTAHEPERCTAPALQGAWTNIRSDVKSLHRLEIETVCKLHPAERTLRIRALEKCYPRDCSWGWSELVEIGPGDFVAVFHTFTARRRLEISVIAGRLRVHVITDYINDAKEDKKTYHLLVRNL